MKTRENLEDGMLNSGASNDFGLDLKKRSMVDDGEDDGYVSLPKPVAILFSI